MIGNDNAIFLKQNDICQSREKNQVKEYLNKSDICKSLVLAEIHLIPTGLLTCLLKFLKEWINHQGLQQLCGLRRKYSQHHTYNFW